MELNGVNKWKECRAESLHIILETRKGSLQLLFHLFCLSGQLPRLRQVRTRGHYVIGLFQRAVFEVLKEIS